MALEYQEPIVKHVNSNVVETTETHPAYGQISASRVSGRAYLYGSDFAHQHFITITIRHSELNRSLSRDWPHGRREIVEVALSEAQWATFVSSMNVGEGVQCTLQHINMQNVPQLPRPKSRVAQFKGEFLDRFVRALDDLKKLRERIIAGKGGKESLSLLDSATREFTSNTEFVAGQFVEHMEGVVEKAKVEVNAYTQGVITRLGISAAVEMEKRSLSAPIDTESDAAPDRPR